MLGQTMGAPLATQNNDTERRQLQQQLQLQQQQHDIQQKLELPSTHADDGDEAAKTQRVHYEAWGRQKLLDHMREDEEENENAQLAHQAHQAQEDDEAIDFPMNARLPLARHGEGMTNLDIQGDSPQQMTDTPHLGFVPKENTQSFGIVGQQQFKPAQVVISEQSEDFYMNSGRSHYHEKMSSQVSAETKGSHFANPPSMRSQPYTDANVFQTNSSFQQMKQNQEAAKFTDVKIASHQAPPMKNLAGQQRSHMNEDNNESSEMPPRYLSETPQSINNIMNKRRDLNDSHAVRQVAGQFMPSTRNHHDNVGEDSYNRFSQQKLQPYHQPTSFQHQPMNSMYTVQRGAHGSGAPSGEQFLTLDHFLNEQSSPLQTVNTPDLSGGQMSSQHRPQLSSDATTQKMMMQQYQQQQFQQQRGATDSGLTASRFLDSSGQRRPFEQQSRPRYDITAQKSPRLASTSPLRVDPDEIKRRQMTRQQTIELKRKQEIENLRNQAKQREIQRQIKLKAIVLIQKWVRGHLCRLEHARMRANFRYIRKLRRLLSIAYGRKKKFFLKQLVFMIKEAGKKHQKQFEEEIGAFCATLIQKVWRGYHFRRVVKRRLLREYKSKRSLRALIQGYRIRCILTRTRDCVNVKRAIQDVDMQLDQWYNQLRNLNPATTTKQQHVAIKRSIKQLKEERSVKVTQLIRSVAHLRSRGRWVYQLLPRPTPRQQQLDNDLLFARQAPPVESAAMGNQNNFFRPGGLMNVNPDDETSIVLTAVGDQRRGNIRGADVDIFMGGDISAGGNLHDETARNLIGSISPLGMHGKPPVQMLREEDDSDLVGQEQLASMWPSKRAPAQEANDDDDLAAMWPSKKAPSAVAVDDEDDALASMWPSQKAQPAKREIKKNPSALDTLRKRIGEYDDVVVGSSGNDNDGGYLDGENEGTGEDDNALGAIVWPSAATKQIKASGPMNVEAKPTSAAAVGKGGTQNDDAAVTAAEEKNRGAVQNSIIIESKWRDQQQVAHWEDLPIKPAQDNNKNAVMMEESKQMNSMANDSKLENSRIQQPPKFGLTDFEAMIEKAMQEAGEQPHPFPSSTADTAAKPSNKPATTAAPSTGENNKEAAAPPNPVKKKKNEQAAALLEKRKRYDPRSALKKGKKGKKPAQKPQNEDVEEQALEEQKKLDEQAQQANNQKQQEASRPTTTGNNTLDSKTKQDAKIEVVVQHEPVKREAAKRQPPASKQNDDKQQQTACGTEGTGTAATTTPPPEDESTAAVKPKPFLKRKTKTMQPAKINWKTKSRIDCWGGQAKPTSTNQKQRDGASPPPSKGSEKTQIEAQQELEQSLPKFSENQPSKATSGKNALQAPQSQQQARNQADVLDTEYECETVPNESQSHGQIGGPVASSRLAQNRKVMHDGHMSPGSLLPPTSSQTQQRNNNMVQNPAATAGMGQGPSKQRLPAQPVNRGRARQTTPLATEMLDDGPDGDEDFDQEPVPRRQMMQPQTTAQSQHQNRVRQHPSMPNSRQPMKTPPDTDTETQNYNTFSQPDFAQPSQIHMGDLMMGQSMLQLNGEAASHIDISEIQAQISSVMTNQEDASQVLSSFHPMDNHVATSRLHSGIPTINSNQFQMHNQSLAGFNSNLNNAGGQQQSNLQLDELQKVFDLFHTQIETVEEMVPPTSLQRLQERNFPRPNGRGLGGTQATKTRTVQKRMIKSHTFADIQIEEVIGQDTCIPHLDSQTSVFFTSYTPEQFEEIFEDLKGHYKRLCDEEPSSMIDDEDDGVVGLEELQDNLSQF